jgi:excisionase family DNA binding protein
MDDLYNTKEAAQYLKIGASTLEHYRLSGRGPQFLKLGVSIVRYKKSDLDEWAHSCRYQSTSQVAAA